MKGDNMNKQKIYDNFMSTLSLVKTCRLTGVIKDEREYDWQVKKVFDNYARQLADGGFLDYAQAKVDLIQYELNENKIMQDNMYQGRSL